MDKITDILSFPENLRKVMELNNPNILILNDIVNMPIDELTEEATKLYIDNVKLQAELKVYKRVVDLACEALSDPACAELRANIFNDSQPPCVDPSKCCAECWKEYLTAKAKGANK